MYDVVALGELLIDFTQVGASESGNLLFERNAGGAPANVLTALAKLGKKTAFIGKVGNDQFGKFLKRVLEDSNIDTTGLILCNKSNTTLAFVHLNSEFDRSFSFYRNPGADMLLEKREVNLNLLNKAKIFHYGSVSMTNEPSRTTTIEVVRYAKERGLIISYDPNLRPVLWNNLGQAKEIICSTLMFTDILKISEEELSFLTEIQDPKDGTQYLFEKYNIPFIFVTLGVKGCFYRMRNIIGYVPSFKVNSIDTTGAGDAFLGGILYQIIENQNRLTKLTDDDVKQIVKFSNLVGALTTTKRGAIAAIPTLEEIEHNGCLFLSKII